MEVEYRRLKASWENGSREREGALRLLYLTWMHWADPLYVTGFTEDDDVVPLWRAICEYFGGEASEDAEFLHVAGLMASLTPEELGDEWIMGAQRMESRSRFLQPNGFWSEHFSGRGAYGDYFAHQARGGPSNTR